MSENMLMRFLVLFLLFPFIGFTQELSIEVQYTDGTSWNGNSIDVFNGEDGEKSYILLDSLDGVKRYAEDIVLIKATEEGSLERILEPAIYHGSLIFSEKSFTSERINIYNFTDSYGDFVNTSGAWDDYQYTKDKSNLRHIDYANLYEDLYENIDSKTYLIKANRLRKIQNAFYGVGGVLFAHAVFNTFNTLYDSDDSTIVIPLSLYFSAISFVVPRFLQRPKQRNLIKSLEIYN